jgi:trans-2,3-dihydro-3-hydroxyanthranilate isomerase
MRRYAFITVDVFTDRRFGGNPLAVFPDAAGISDAEMQSLANEFNLSETTFVLPPSDPANDARVRIFNRVAEMPFAGHPNVGTGWVLASLGRVKGDRLRFEEIAGLVEVRFGADRLVTIDAPQPLSLGPEMPIDLLAGCASLSPADVVTTTHPPVMASVGNSFVVAEVTGPALTRAAPDLARFRQAHQSFTALGPGRLPIYLYARVSDAGSTGMLRARLFSPLSGNNEDAATGSAATPLAALLLSKTTHERRRYDIVQGVEMGRPSLLLAEAWRAGGVIRASVGGTCVEVLAGEASL